VQKGETNRYIELRADLMRAALIKLQASATDVQERTACITMRHLPAASLARLYTIIKGED